MTAKTIASRVLVCVLASSVLTSTFGSSLVGVDYSADDKYLVTDISRHGSGKSYKVWNVDTGELVREFGSDANFSDVFPIRAGYGSDVRQYPQYVYFVGSMPQTKIVVLPYRTEAAQPLSEGYLEYIGQYGRNTNEDTVGMYFDLASGQTEAIAFRTIGKTGDGSESASSGGSTGDPGEGNKADGKAVLDVSKALGVLDGFINPQKKRRKEYLAKEEANGKKRMALERAYSIQRGKKDKCRDITGVHCFTGPSVISDNRKYMAIVSHDYSMEVENDFGVKRKTYLPTNAVYVVDTDSMRTVHYVNNVFPGMHIIRLAVSNDGEMLTYDVRGESKPSSGIYNINSRKTIGSVPHSRTGWSYAEVTPINASTDLGRAQVNSEEYGYWKYVNLRNKSEVELKYPKKVTETVKWLREVNGQFQVDGIRSSVDLENMVSATLYRYTRLGGNIDMSNLALYQTKRPPARSQRSRNVVKKYDKIVVSELRKGVILSEYGEGITEGWNGRNCEAEFSHKAKRMLVACEQGAPLTMFDTTTGKRLWSSSGG